ncbi:MAG: nitroreductase family protein [Bacteroidales bacterium]|jgi:nitroreductase|nr:nitroreductase family protein [Bacteroidales bacterium]
MAFIDLAKKRYSSRKYLDKPVEKELLLQVLDAARVAPSAKNKQPWHFVVVTNEELLKDIKGCYDRTWLETAKCIIVVCGDHREAWRRADGKSHTDIDVAITIDHMTLAATDLGLSTCWICKFDVLKCANIMELPEGVEPIALIPLGYPADKTDENRHERLRKPLDEIVHWEKFFYKPFKRVLK